LVGLFCLIIVSSSDTKVFLFCGLGDVTIYINNLPDVVQNVAKLFADDTKLYAAVNNTNHEIKLQGDTDRLVQWSKEWLLTFNKSKCKHVHFGSPNNARYQMGGDIITQSTEEKDLGITR
jgi:hypothetical protein